MFTDDLRQDLHKILAEGESTLEFRTRRWIVSTVEDWLHDNKFAKVYTEDEAKLEYLNFLDGVYSPVSIDGLEIKASDIIQNLPGDTFNNKMSRFIYLARNGIIK